MNNLDKIIELRDRGALFVLNNSGGKDSQAQQIKVRELVPDSQILVVHAHLPGVEWEGTAEHVYTMSEGLEVRTTTAVKTFLDMVKHRQMWPSPQLRQCTSDLKRGPIEKEIRHFLKDHPEFNGLVVNCMGLRAEESTSRAKCETFKFSKRNSKAGREWYDWLPIHDMLIGEVFATIAAAGQKPHWAYAAGMTRLSCCFCIMASQEDLRTAARLNPETYAIYVNLEREINHSFVMPRKGQAPRFLEEVTGIKVRVAA